MAKKTRKTNLSKSKKTSKAKRPAKKIASIIGIEPDSVFFLKIVIFLILGTQWIYIESLPNWQAPIPVGLILGLVFATHEHFQIDRKIEYAVLLVATFIAFWLPIGITISV